MKNGFNPTSSIEGKPALSHSLNNSLRNLLPFRNLENQQKNQMNFQILSNTPFSVSKKENLKPCEIISCDNKINFKNEDRMNSQNSNTKYKNILTESENCQSEKKCKYKVAYGKAMKALQEKIQKLEFTNNNLNDQIINLKENITIKDENFNKEINEQKMKYANAENGNKQLNDQLKKEISKLKSENTNLIKEREFIKAQMDIVIMEKERHIEQNSKEKENFKKDQNILIQKMNSDNVEIQQFKEKVKSQLGNLNDLKIQLNNERQFVSNLKKKYELDIHKKQEEIDLFKKNSKILSQQYEQEISILKNVKIK